MKNVTNEQEIIWSLLDGECKVHCKNKEHYEKILRWKGCRHGSVYRENGRIIAYDVIIPERFVDRARKLLQSCAKSETSKIDENRTKSVLNANDLQGTKSPSRA